MISGYDKVAAWLIEIGVILCGGGPKISKHDQHNICTCLLQIKNMLIWTLVIQFIGI